MQKQQQTQTDKKSFFSFSSYIYFLKPFIV